MTYMRKIKFHDLDLAGLYICLVYFGRRIRLKMSDHLPTDGKVKCRKNCAWKV